MRRFLVRASLAGPLGLASAVLVACGSSSPQGFISAAQNSQLQGQLDKISQAISNNKCKAAEAAAAGFATDVANLPSTVNPTLRQNLIQGASTVAQLTPTTCAQNASTGVTTPTQTTTSTPTQAQTTATTAPATTTSTPPVTQTQTPPPPPTTTTSSNTGPPPTTTGSGGVNPGGSTGAAGNSGTGSGGAGLGG